MTTKKRTRTTTKTPRNAGKSFSVKATAFLENNAGYLTTKQIASRLGRTSKSIQRKASKLGVSLAV